MYVLVYLCICIVVFFSPKLSMDNSGVFLRFTGRRIESFNILALYLLPQPEAKMIQILRNITQFIVPKLHNNSHNVSSKITH